MDEGGQQLPNEVALGVAENLFFNEARFPAEAPGAVAFRAFESFFRLANLQAGLLRTASSSGGDHLDGGGTGVAVTPAGVGRQATGEAGSGGASVWDLRLRGLEHLWGIALRAKNAAVCRTAEAFLVSLYCNLPYEGEGEAAAITEDRDSDSSSFLSDSVGAPVPMEATAASRPSSFTPTSDVLLNVEGLRLTPTSTAEGVGGGGGGDDFNHACRRGVWASFVQRCLAAMGRGSSGATVGMEGKGSAAASRSVLRATQLLVDFFHGIDASYPHLVRTGGQPFDNEEPPPARYFASTASWLLELEGPDLTGHSAVARTDTILVWLQEPTPPGGSGLEGEAVATAPPLKRLVVTVRPAVETLGTLRDRIADAAGVPPAVSSAGSLVRLIACQRASPPPTSSSGSSLYGSTATTSPSAAAAAAAVAAASALASDGLPRNPPPIGGKSATTVAAQFDVNALGALKPVFDFVAIVLDAPAEDTLPHVYTPFQARCRTAFVRALTLLRAAAAGGGVVTTFSDVRASEEEEAVLDVQYARWRARRLADWDAMQAPRRAIADVPDAFNVVFRLLSCGRPTLVGAAWRLLQLLPVNEAAERDIRTLCGRYGGA